MITKAKATELAGKIKNSESNRIKWALPLITENAHKLFQLASWGVFAVEHCGLSKQRASQVKGAVRTTVELRKATGDDVVLVAERDVDALGGASKAIDVAKGSKTVEAFFAAVAAAKEEASEASDDDDADDDAEEASEAGATAPEADAADLVVAAIRALTADAANVDGNRVAEYAARLTVAQLTEAAEAIATILAAKAETAPGAVADAAESSIARAARKRGRKVAAAEEDAAA